MEYCMRLMCENIKDCKTKPCNCDKLDVKDKCSFCIKKCKNAGNKPKEVN